MCVYGGGGGRCVTVRDIYTEKQRHTLHFVSISQLDEEREKDRDRKIINEWMNE